MKQLVLSISLVLALNSGYGQVEKEAEFFTKLPVSISDSLLRTFVLDWKGNPYRLGGKTERGIDCSQFNKRLAADVYRIRLGNTCSDQWKETIRVKKDNLRAGDLVFFRSVDSPTGWHCGTYIGDTYFIHAANAHQGVIVSSLNDSAYMKRYKGGGRYKK